MTQPIKRTQGWEGITGSHQEPRKDSTHNLRSVAVVTPDFRLPVSGTVRGSISVILSPQVVFYSISSKEPVRFLSVLQTHEVLFYHRASARVVPTAQTLPFRSCFSNLNPVFRVFAHMLPPKRCPLRPLDRNSWPRSPNRDPSGSRLCAWFLPGFLLPDGETTGPSITLRRDFSRLTPPSRTPSPQPVLCFHIASKLCSFGFYQSPPTPCQHICKRLNCKHNLK